MCCIDINEQRDPARFLEAVQFIRGHALVCVPLAKFSLDCVQVAQLRLNVSWRRLRRLLLAPSVRLLPEMGRVVQLWSKRSYRRHNLVSRLLLHFRSLFEKVDENVIRSIWKLQLYGVNLGIWSAQDITCGSTFLEWNPNAPPTSEIQIHVKLADCCAVFGVTLDRQCSASRHCSINPKFQSALLQLPSINVAWYGQCWRTCVAVVYSHFQRVGAMLVVALGSADWYGSGCLEAIFVWGGFEVEYLDTGARWGRNILYW